MSSLNRTSEPLVYYIFNPSEKTATRNNLENELYYKGSKTVIYKMS